MDLTHECHACRLCNLARRRYAYFAVEQASALVQLPQRVPRLKLVRHRLEAETPRHIGQLRADGVPVVVTLVANLGTAGAQSSLGQGLADIPSSHLRAEVRRRARTTAAVAAMAARHHVVDDIDATMHHSDDVVSFRLLTVPHRQFLEDGNAAVEAVRGVFQ